MINFTNAFTYYEGTSLIPGQLTSFVILPITFTVNLSDKNSELYTLSKLTLISSSFMLHNSSFMHIALTFQYEYSQKDLCHTLHTFNYTHQLLFAWSYPNTPTTLYIEDIFAYSLNPKQIYTSLLVLIVAS